MIGFDFISRLPDLTLYLTRSNTEYNYYLLAADYVESRRLSLSSFKPRND